jgi:hypothetical protein
MEARKRQQNTSDVLCELSMLSATLRCYSFSTLPFILRMHSTTEGVISVIIRPDRCATSSACVREFTLKAVCESSAEEDLEVAGT